MCVAALESPYACDKTFEVSLFLYNSQFIFFIICLVLVLVCLISDVISMVISAFDNYPIVVSIC